MTFPFWTSSIIVALAPLHHETLYLLIEMSLIAMFPESLAFYFNI